MKLITNTKIDIEHFEKELMDNNLIIINHLFDYIELNELRIDKNKKVEYVLAYIKFWGLSTQRLSKTFLQDYFKLLLSEPDYNIKTLCLSSNGKIQFSFATKLLHTFNPENPPYDSKVKNYLKIKKKSNSNSSEFYQNYCLEFNELLKMYSSRLTKLREKIKQLSKDEKVEYINNKLSTINDVKLLDSVIWYLQKERDKLKQKG